jgi:hypothetical protein
MREEYCLYIGRTNQLPPEESKNQHEIIFCLEDFEKEVKNLKMEYLVLVLFKTSDYLDSDNEYIKIEWKELTDGEISIELISKNPKHIKNHLKKIFNDFENNTVLFKSPFVGFSNNSEAGYKSAYSLLRKSSLKPFWNFWS